MSTRNSFILLFFIFALAVPASGVAAHDCSTSWLSGTGARFSLVGVRRIYTNITEPLLVGTYYGWVYIGTYRGVWDGRSMAVEVACGNKIPLGLV